MRVMFLQPQPCIRALKLARGLKKTQGKKISIIFGYLDKRLTEFYGFGDEYFDEVIRLDREDLEGSISRLVEKYNPHLIHSHNAPDFLTVSALNAANGTPVIHDVHDSLTMRDTGYYEGDDEAVIQGYAEDEKTACVDSHGRIYVTEMLGGYIQRRYGLGSGFDLVFHNYVSEDVIPIKLDDRLSTVDGETHIVYAGTITSKTDGHHYDLRDIFREMAKNQLHIHIYAAREDEGYRLLGEESPFIHYHGHLGQRELLQVLPRYDFGWAGFNDSRNKEHLDVVLPNKAYEYIACGLPVLTFPHRTLSEFVQSRGLGSVIEDFGSGEWLEKAEGLRENVLRKRYDFTIEKNIGRMSEFYWEITKLRV
jgi:glycosyltransferase involved in cell wall biosynthesis